MVLLGSFFLVFHHQWKLLEVFLLFRLICIKFGGARQVTYINAEAVVESSRTFRKLPQRSLAFLGFTLIAQTHLGHDLAWKGIGPNQISKVLRLLLNWASQYWIYLHRLGRYLNWD